MYIVSKDRMTVINAEQISAIYVSSGTNIRTETAGGRTWNIGRYDSGENAQAALDMLVERIRSVKEETVFVPRDRDIQAMRALEEQKYHHMAGKKMKGHGGS